MIIREDLDTKLRKGLAIHYGLDKVYVEKIHIIYFDDKFQWVHYLDEPYLMALHIGFEDLVKSLIDKFEKYKIRIYILWRKKDIMKNLKRSYSCTVKLNEEENNQLEFIAKELSISKAEVIRELIADSSYELYYGHKRGKNHADKI